MKEQEKDILRGFSAGAAPTRREMNLAAPERRDARVGELCWPYRLAKDGGAEILGLPSPEPAGALTVPRQLDGHPVTAIADEAFSGCAGLVSVVLPDGVTVVDDGGHHSDLVGFCAIEARGGFAAHDVAAARDDGDFVFLRECGDGVGEMRKCFGVEAEAGAAAENFTR